MAHSLSRRKRVRQNLKRRAINRARTSVLKKKVRKVTDAIIHKQGDEAAEHFKAVIRTLDREADRGLIHRNAAARKKSRLAKKINALRAAAS